MGHFSLFGIEVSVFFFVVGLAFGVGVSKYCDIGLTFHEM